MYLFPVSHSEIVGICQYASVPIRTSNAEIINPRLISLMTSIRHCRDNSLYHDHSQNTPYPMAVSRKDHAYDKAKHGLCLHDGFNDQCHDISRTRRTEFLGGIRLAKHNIVACRTIIWRIHVIDCRLHRYSVRSNERANA